jgi:hypothetical protein
VVQSHRPLEQVIISKLGEFALLVGPDGSPEERRRAFKGCPWWHHFVESYYRGELELARREGIKSPSNEAEIRVGTALGISPASVHSICTEVRGMRKEDELSANFPPMTLADHENWMENGSALFWQSQRIKRESISALLSVSDRSPNVKAGLLGNFLCQVVHLD